MRTLAILAFVLLILPLLLLAAGQFGMFKGRPPTEPGLREGKLKPPSRTQNSASSQAALWPEGEYAVDYAKIEPLAFTQDSALAMNRLREVLANWPGAHVVENSPEYLSCSSEALARVVDDAEFCVIPRARYPSALSVATWPQDLNPSQTK